MVSGTCSESERARAGAGHTMQGIGSRGAAAHEEWLVWKATAYKVLHPSPSAPPRSISLKVPLVALALSGTRRGYRAGRCTVDQ